ncbi:hypothetical protein B0H14DRAFT_1392921 [Mycena olivaceomarginata]|nr:hypothetical protein B0H14DRAFT_1392921 [Mycena olivaceomarginata]
MLQSCTPPLRRLCWQHIPYCPLQCQCACALRAVPHLPFATTPQSARLLAAPLHHTSASAACPTDPPLRQAQGYTVALPSAHPHPRALHATPLVSVIASRFGECRAVLALPFWRWRRTSLPRHGEEVPRQMRIGRAVAPLRRSAPPHLAALRGATRSHCAPTSNDVKASAQCRLQVPGTTANVYGCARSSSTSTAMGEERVR